MTDFTYNRYNDLISAIPGGSFYDSAGIVIPYRGKNTTQMRLETGSPNTTYVLYFNEIIKGEVTSDSEGNVVFQKVLPLGEVEITLLNKTTGRSQYTFVTTRDYAIWLASHADALERVDSNIQAVRDNMAIATASSEALTDFYGKAVDTYNNIGLSTDTYRGMLHELRLGYRSFGGQYKGLETAISAFTQVPPLSYARRMWGPNWFLNHSFLLNNNFLDRSHSVQYDTTEITGVTLLRVEPDCTPALGPAHSLYYDSVANTLTWEPHGGSGEAIDITDGELFLPGPASSIPVYILGEAGPFDTTSNNKLYIRIDDDSTVEVSLTAGPGTIVATIAGDINASIAGLASTYAPTGGLLLEIASGSIYLEPGPDNAAALLFGSKSQHYVFATESQDGIAVTQLSDNSTGGLVSMGTGGILFTYNYAVIPVVRELSWESSIGSGYGASVAVTGSGNYELIDSLGNSCFVNVIEDDLISSGTGSQTYTFTYNYSIQKETVGETQGLWVRVDTTQLPATDTTVDVLVIDDTVETPAEIVETPDYWEIFPLPTGGEVYEFLPSIISDSRDTYLEPCLSFAFKYESADRVVDFSSKVRNFPLSDYIPRGSASPNVGGPGGVYDYEGFDLIFSGYVRNLTSDILDVILSVSFDGGLNWEYSLALPIAVDSSDGYIDPTYVMEEFTIPANVSVDGDSSIVVRVSTDSSSGAGSTAVILEGFTVEVKYISSRYLTNATIARSRHRQYFGELVYMWSPELLTINERRYLGLPHVIVSRSVPISGMEITYVDPATPTGAGELEYEYDSTAGTYRARWAPRDLSWGAGVGWVYLTDDGDYTLTAPDSTTLTANVVFSLLPRLASKIVSLSVSSNRSYQGHSRKIAPAHSSIDIFDVTEYDSTTGSALNLKGLISEADFSLASLTNLKISSAEPFRYSYLYPVVPNITGEELTFVTAGADFDADLDYDSDQNFDNTVLYEDGLPVPNDVLSYADADTLRIDGASYNSSAVYTLDYSPVCEVLSDVIDMEATRTDYSWWADYMLWERYEAEKGEFPTTTPVFFNLNTGRAYLDRRSTKNLNDSRLFVVSGNRTEERTIPKRYWKFLDDFTVVIDISQIQAGQYFLTHKEKRVYKESNLTVVFNHRSGTNPTNCRAATWEVLEKNEAIDVTNRYHQLQLVVSGMRDVRDFRIRSLVMKGLRLQAADPYVPAMTDIWGA